MIAFIAPIIAMWILYFLWYRTKKENIELRNRKTSPTDPTDKAREKDIKTIMDYTKCDRARAIKILDQNERP